MTRHRAASVVLDEELPVFGRQRDSAPLFKRVEFGRAQRRARALKGHCPAIETPLVGLRGSAVIAGDRVEQLSIPLQFATVLLVPVDVVARAAEHFSARELQAEPPCPRMFQNADLSHLVVVPEFVVLKLPVAQLDLVAAKMVDQLAFPAAGDFGELATQALGGVQQLAGCFVILCREGQSKFKLSPRSGEARGIIPPDLALVAPLVVFKAAQRLETGVYLRIIGDGLREQLRTTLHELVRGLQSLPQLG